MSRRCWPLGIASAFVLYFACSEGPTLRPAISGDCNEAGCADSRRGISPVSTRELRPAGSTGGSGTGGTAGTGSPGGSGAGGVVGMPPPAAGTLVGSIRMVVEPDLLGSDSPDAAVEVRAPGSNETEVVAIPGADGSFRLDDVLMDQAVWVAVGAFDDPPSDPFMDTLQVATPVAAEPVSLVVVRRTVMEEIAQVSFLTNPIELDPRRGHAIVSFVDELGVPISGLRVVFPAPEDVGVAYDAGDIYSDTQLETSTRGSVVLLNLPAAPYPGVVTNVVAEVASLAQQLRANLRVAAGSVTVLTVALDLSP